MLPAYDIPTAPTQETVNVMTDQGEYSRQCLGALVAPRVVVTASHCVHRTGKMTVDRALVEGDKPVEVQRMLWSPGFKSGPIDTNKSDVAILVLAKPIHLPSYPLFATNVVREGTHAMGESRTPRGLVSYAFSLRRENSYYLSGPWAKSGDSGGPIYAGSGRHRRIIAVTSATTNGGVLLARVDVISELIEKTISETETEVGS